MLSGHQYSSKIVNENTYLDFAEDLKTCGRFLYENTLPDPQECFLILMGLILTKWYEESSVEDSIGSGSGSIIAEIKILLHRAISWYEQRLEPSRFSPLAALQKTREFMSTESSIVKLIPILWAWNLKGSRPLYRIRGFDCFIDSVYRGIQGEYVTPPQVARLMVGILQPTVRDFIGDPAIGTGRTVIYAAEYARQSRKIDPTNEDISGRLGRYQPQDSSYARFNDDHVFGMEVNEFTATVAYVSFLMAGISTRNLFVGNSIARWESIKDIAGNLSSGFGFQRGGLTAALVDPPLGFRITDQEVLKEYAEQSGLTYYKGRVSKSVPSELLFLNRCLDLVEPSGRLVILLPEGVLSNPSTQYVRQWILERARLKAIISLPQNAFSDYGANVKMSLLALEKRPKPLDKSLLKEENYNVYMAHIDNIKGTPYRNVKSNDDIIATSPEITRVIDEFTYQVGW